jgi:signal transduction histidine kinase
MEAIVPANSLMLHDIKNLAFRLGALLQNLEVNYEDPLFKKSVVEILDDTVRRMDRIVRRCRDRRGEVIVKVPVDLNEILIEIVEHLPRRPRNEKEVFIEERYSRLPKIWGDPEFLREAFAIIVQNALEAMQDRGGRLTLSTGTAASRAGRRRIVVRVADTGCGMSPEFIDNGLFAPFVSTKEDGLGMGLYACRKIIALHDGTIRVSSREGRGTTFRLSFNTA